MKIIVTVIISFLYLIGTMPVFLSFHYCGKNFQYITVNKVEEKESCCGKNEMPSHGCCSDKTVSFDVDDQAPAKVLSLQHAPTAIDASLHASYYIPDNTEHYLHEVFKISHSPPLINGVRLHIANCVFLI